jgi:hypothetical protein
MQKDAKIPHSSKFSLYSLVKPVTGVDSPTRLMQRKIRSFVLIETNYILTRVKIFISSETEMRHK